MKSIYPGLVDEEGVEHSLSYWLNLKSNRMCTGF